VYGNDLKKRTVNYKENNNEISQPPDSINISCEARQKEMLNRISNNIVLQITKNDYYNNKVEQIK